MKREILFRAKRKDNGEWIYGYPIIDNADCSLKAEGKCSWPHDGSHADLLYWNDEFHEYEGVEVDAETIGQYTSLKDKNGVKIFEDDIVSYVPDDQDEEGTDYYSILFYNGSFRISPTECINQSYANELEVVGNVFDNPELIK